MYSTGLKNCICDFFLNSVIVKYTWLVKILFEISDGFKYRISAG